MDIAKQIEIAEENVRIAASKGYDAYTNAKRALQDLQDQALIAELGDTADDTVVVLGKTYQVKSEIKSLGFNWNQIVKGWVGKRKDIHGQVPDGCYLETYGQAALNTMDKADSDI